jgi:hypothetical protein
MSDEKKEVIRKGYQPNKGNLKNENAPRGRVSIPVRPKGDKKQKTK